MVVSSNDTQNVVLHDIGVSLLLCTSCLRISIWNILNILKWPVDRKNSWNTLKTWESLQKRWNIPQFSPWKP